MQARQGLTVSLLARQFSKDFIEPHAANGTANARLVGACRGLLACRGAELLVLSLPLEEAMSSGLRGDKPIDVINAVLSGAVHRAISVGGLRADSPEPAEDVSWLIPAILGAPVEALAWFEDRQTWLASSGDGSNAAAGPDQEMPADYFTRLAALVQDLERLDFHARATVRHGDSGKGAPEPFDVPEMLPNFVAAEPRRRTAVFLHNSYYHFNCLSEGLKRRGWSALTVSLYAPDDAQRQFFHGEDINLYDPDPVAMRRRVREFFQTVPERFGALHFYGRGMPSFFASHFENSGNPERIPWDFLELRRHGVIIGYMPSGCLDGAPQSSIRALTNGLCGRCVWELRQDLCSDAINLAGTASLPCSATGSASNATWRRRDKSEKRRSMARSPRRSTQSAGGRTSPCRVHASRPPGWGVSDLPFGRQLRNATQR